VVCCDITVPVQKMFNVLAQDRVTDMYYEEQSPLTTVKMIGASKEAVNKVFSQDECNGGQQMNSTDVSSIHTLCKSLVFTC